MMYVVDIKDIKKKKEETTPEINVPDTNQPKFPELISNMEHGTELWQFLVSKLRRLIHLQRRRIDVHVLFYLSCDFQ